MRNSLDKRCTEIENTFFPIIFPPENLAFYEIMWKKYNRARQATGDNMDS